MYSVPGVVGDKIRLHLIGWLMEKLCVLFYFAWWLKSRCSASFSYLVPGRP